MFNSLRRRIQLWNALFMAIAIAVFGVFLYVQHERSVHRSMDDEISAAVAVLVGKLQAASPVTLRDYIDPDPDRLINSWDISRGTFDSDRPSDRPSGRQSRDGRRPPRGGGPGGPGDISRFEKVVKLQDDLHLPEVFELRHLRHDFEQPYFVIYRDDGSILKSSDHIDIADLPQIEHVKDRTSLGTEFRNRGHYREAYAAGVPKTSVLVGRHTGHVRHRMRSYALMIAGIGTGIWLTGLLGGWLLSRSSTQPIDSISKVAADISGRNLDDRIDASKMDVEFVDLADTLNNMFSRLESAFAQQRQFAANASHELRTPLSVIKMHQELALSKPRTEEEYRESIEICQRSTERMSSLVESLLVLARLDSGSARLKAEPFDLAGVIQGEVEKLEAIFARNGIEIVTDLQPITVNGDAGQIGRVVSNLLTNARKYSAGQDQSDGDRKVKICMKRHEGNAVISVTDFGQGIAAEELEKIFDRFYRVEAERSRETGGSGLGLSICKSIAERHGGSISVDSTVGQGSTFRVSIPLGDSGDKSPAQNGPV